MDCVKDETCWRGTFKCCYSCDIDCETHNECNDEDCEHHPINKPTEE